MNLWLIAFIVCVAAFTTTAIVWDLRYWRMPNWLTVSAFAAGLLFHATLGAVDGGAWGALDHVKISLLGFAVGFGFMFVMWVIGSGGGGDVKFLGAVGAWLGPIPTVFVIILSAIIAGAIAFGTFVYRSSSRGMRSAFNDMKLNKQAEGTAKGRQQEEKKKKRLTPYAVSAALATWLVVGILSVANSSNTKYWRSDVVETAPPATAADSTKS